jgi:2-oxoisovalerate dehydrogenase E1 component
MQITEKHFLNKEINLTDLLKSAYRLMFTAKTMTDLFEQEKKSLRNMFTPLLADTKLFNWL